MRYIDRRSGAKDPSNARVSNANRDYSDDQCKPHRIGDSVPFILRQSLPQAAHDLAGSPECEGNSGGRKDGG
jgi:hypothetical protein